MNFAAATTSQDGSIALLQQLFNFKLLINAINHSGTAVHVATDALGTMFQVLNSFALVATGLVLMYMYSIAIMQTAHDGEPLGKRYSTLWAPIRSVAAVVFVSPFPGLGGFSVLQGIILSMVAVSINGANMLYNSELNFYKTNDYSLMPLSANAQPDPVLAANILKTEVCQAYVNENDASYGVMVQQILLGDGDPNVYGYSWPGSYDPATTHNAFTPAAPLLSCGSVKVDCSQVSSNAPAGRSLCGATGIATETLVAKLKPVAKSIVAGKMPDKNAIIDALNSYSKAWTQASVAAQAETTNSQKQALDEFIQQAGIGGWITAGQWYWTLSATTLQDQAAGDVQPEYSPIDYSTFPNFKSSFLPYLKRVQVYLQQTPGVTLTPTGAIADKTGSGGSATNGGHDTTSAIINKIFGHSFGANAQVLTGLLEGNNDPVRSLASYGQDMIGAGWGIVGTYVAMSGAAGMAKGIPLVGSIAGGAASGVLKALLAPVYIIAGILMAQGGFLAYYLPAIPFIFWSFGVLGWLLLVVESLIAAPLWAAAHAVPEGDGFAGRYALQGWQLFVNVVFRPILLTVGLLLSFLIMEAICHFALVGYKYTNLSIVNSTSLVSISGVLFTNIIMASLVIALAHKSHELIYEGADNIMRFLGFGVAGLGSVNPGMVEGSFKGAGSVVNQTTGDTVKHSADAIAAAGSTRGGSTSGGRPFNPVDDGGPDINKPH